jgi:rubrerythrin
VTDKEEPMAQTEATLERVRVDGPVKNTLHNLIQTLSIKLDSAARYGLYTEDARIDGYEDCAELFGRLAEQERRAIDDLKGCLRNHAADL